jgi:predicted Zn-dependent protease
LSLLYNKNGESLKADRTLLNGLKIDPNNENLLYALAFQYANANQIDKAKTVLIKLIQLYPNNTDYQRFLQQISSNSNN